MSRIVICALDGDNLFSGVSVASQPPPAMDDAEPEEQTSRRSAVVPRGTAMSAEEEYDETQLVLALESLSLPSRSTPPPPPPMGRLPSLADDEDVEPVLHFGFLPSWI